VTKAAFHGQVSEAELIALVARSLPKHCIPAMVDIRTESLPRNGVGKTVKSELKVELAKVWEERKKGRAKL
jgi:acyl-CoA synthetase (AMP-forming)/AMP-acid ligase II